MQPLTVLVYDDEGVSQTSLQSILSVFQLKMQYLGVPIGRLTTVSSYDILNDKLLDADCLIMPGGADLPYCHRLNGEGNRKIRSFVAAGNVYIGICAGAYYATTAIAFTGEGYTINGERELALFSGQAVGSIAEFTDGRYYDETAASKAIVNLNFYRTFSDCTADFYYHGGSYFLGAEEENLLATYNTGKVAAVTGTFGKGKYLLSGVHFELCADIYESCIFSDNVLSTLSPKVANKEKQLVTLLRDEQYGMIFYAQIAYLLKR